MPQLTFTVNAVDKATLNKVRSEIASRMDARHHEFEVLFDKLRAEVQDVFSGIIIDEHVGETQVPQRSKKEMESDFFLGQVTDRPSTAEEPKHPQWASVPPVKMSELQDQGFFGSCGANCAPPVDCSKEYQETQESQYLVPAQASVTILKGPNGAPVSSNEVDLHPNQTSASPTAGPNFGKLDSQQSALGQPIGEFEGRLNLFAFLQAKNWDSSKAQKPLVEAEVAIDTRPVLWQKFEAAIMSVTFDLLVGALILANSVVMALQLEFDAISVAGLLGMEGDDATDDWPSAQDAFGALDHFFAIIFLVELFLRLAIMGCGYFKVALNWMDFIIVAVAIIELYLIPLSGSEAPDMSIIRLLRILRVVRVLRMVRVLKLFPKLRVLVVAIATSIGSLMWSLVLLGLVQLIAAIFMTQSLQSYLQDETQDLESRKQVYVYFGNFSRSCITLFEVTLASGTWGRCGRVVVFSVSRWYAIFFLLYMGMVSFAMIRVIAAIFLKDTLTSAAKDAELAIAAENRDPEYVKNCWLVFKQFDIDGDAVITLSELYKGLKKKSVCEQLTGLGVVPHELPGLFTLMDDGDNEIAFCEFLSGIMRLKIANKGVDLPTLLYENKKILKEVHELATQVHDLKDTFGSSMLQKTDASNRAHFAPGLRLV